MKPNWYFGGPFVVFFNTSAAYSYTNPNDMQNYQKIIKFLAPGMSQNKKDTFLIRVISKIRV